MSILEILSMVASIGSFIVAIIALIKITSINKLIINLNANYTSTNSQENSSFTNQNIKGVKASGSVNITANDIKHE